MRARCRSACSRGTALCDLRLAVGLWLLIGAGCHLPPNPPSPAEPAAETDPRIPDADTAFTLVKRDHPEETAVSSPRLVHELAMLHILVPQGQEAAVDKIWNFLREDCLDAETRLRLYRNGLRVGVGHVQDWPPIQAAMDAIEDHQVMSPMSLSVPVGFPLSLELDAEPHDQTLFYVGPDGFLSGGTWPESRNVLRVTYAPDRHDADRVWLFAVPEVHQRRDGWEWVRTEAGLWQVPRQTTQAFDAVGFFLLLSPGEFALVAPSANARIYGLLGRAFLTRESEGRCYTSSVFLRPEARHVGQYD